MKRFKSSEGTFREELALGSTAGTAPDLYAGHDHTRLPATPTRDLPYIKHEKLDQVSF